MKRIQRPHFSYREVGSFCRVRPPNEQAHYTSRILEKSVKVCLANESYNFVRIKAIARKLTF